MTLFTKTQHEQLIANSGVRPIYAS